MSEKIKTHHNLKVFQQINKEQINKEQINKEQRTKNKSTNNKSTKQKKHYTNAYICKKIFTQCLNAQFLIQLKPNYSIKTH